jgi:hypothetical protein
MIALNQMVVVEVEQVNLSQGPAVCLMLECAKVAPACFAASPPALHPPRPSPLFPCASVHFGQSYQLSTTRSAAISSFENSRRTSFREKNVDALYLTPQSAQQIVCASHQWRGRLNILELMPRQLAKPGGACAVQLSSQRLKIDGRLNRRPSPADRFGWVLPLL